MSKKQTSQSHSTPEAEIVALDVGVRTEGIPALEPWKVLLGREPLLCVWEDNEATIKNHKIGQVSDHDARKTCPRGIGYVSP